MHIAMEDHHSMIGCVNIERHSEGCWSVHMAGRRAYE